jgi:hypothetical protein
MKPIAAVLRLTSLALIAAAAVPVGARAQSASAPSAAASAAVPAAAGLPPSGAVQACEQAVRSTLRSSRGAAAEVTFNAPPAGVPGSAEVGDLMLRGAGRARSDGNVRTFTYSCTYDTAAASVSGVVLRDAAAAGDRAAGRAAPVGTVEPDLSQISPASCESAAATALKRRWPNVGRIAFNADTRSLQQDSAGTAMLAGQGTAQPQLGSELSSHFSYQCSLDARTGRVLALRLAD